MLNVLVERVDESRPIDDCLLKFTDLDRAEKVVFPQLLQQTHDRAHKLALLPDIRLEFILIAAYHCL